MKPTSNSTLLPQAYANRPSPWTSLHRALAAAVGAAPRRPGVQGRWKTTDRVAIPAAS